MFYDYFILFVIYSCLGWLIEVFVFLFDDKKFVNRGFLIGPYCPIYGVGGILITLFLTKYENDALALFASGIIICSILEYFTSWFMEKIFKLRWWDYSEYKFNINGRICLETMVPFALIGMVVIKFLNPYFFGKINLLSNTAKIIITIILMIILITDYILSIKIVVDMKKATKLVKKDSTEDIRRVLSNFLKKNSALYKRLMEAFPKIKKEKLINTIERKIKEKKSNNDK